MLNIHSRDQGIHQHVIVVMSEWLARVCDFSSFGIFLKCSTHCRLFLLHLSLPFFLLKKRKYKEKQHHHVATLSFRSGLCVLCSEIRL